MTEQSAHDKRMAEMTFATVFPLYLEKIEKKGRTRQELLKVITWLTGYSQRELFVLIDEEVTFELFFKHARLHPNAHLITGVVCGYKVQDIENPLTQKVRYLDKLVDELAKGKDMEKILRRAK